MKCLRKQDLLTRSANPVGAGLTIAGTTISTIGEQAFEKEDRVAKQLGINRADLIKLPEDQKNKLYSMLDKESAKQLAGEQEKISLGEQMRNLSSNPTTRTLDSGAIETDPMIDNMLMSGQI